ncbi:hypothetical protein ACE7GA_03085 [Roseomonas sp. CCTCC AB2023176]|uniref:hypothetical protein n=1 Tax=Roseomonas sp. CCTCC AB2023176 TaxID=3342640 RepID=UPI0035E0B32F
MTKTVRTTIRTLALAGVTGLALMAASPNAEAQGWHRRGPAPGAVAAGIVGGLALGAIAGAAVAAPPPVYYAPPPPPVYYAPAPVYAPPPVYYAPPPVYYAPRPYWRPYW